MVACVRTCSYGGRTGWTVAIRGVKPSFMVVRCSSMVVALRYRRRQLAAGVLRRSRHGGGLDSQCTCMTPQRQKQNHSFTKSNVFAAGESCNRTGSLDFLSRRATAATAGRQLAAAIAQRHDHGWTPDHHERRSDTPDRHGHPGPTPVAASPQKRRQTATPKSGRFWVLLT